MENGRLEHVNITVADPARTADMLCDLFDWHVRWQGDAISGGYSVHVGGHSDYIAVYSPGNPAQQMTSSYQTKGGLNHVGVVVQDLDQAEQKVRLAGFKPYSHSDYEPGRRFYFEDGDGIEWEVVSYA